MNHDTFLVEEFKLGCVRHIITVLLLKVMILLSKILLHLGTNTTLQQSLVRIGQNVHSILVSAHL
ncbi:hypothetical protein D3C80_2075600 [compost metagenome]